MLSHINAVTSGVSMPHEDANGESTPINVIRDKDTGSGRSGEIKSLATLSAEDYLRS